MLLSQYLQRVQLLVGDPKGEEFNPFDLTLYINLARGQVASEGQCIRRLTPIQAGVTAVTQGAAGSGYTAAQVSVGAPDIVPLNGIGATAQVTPNIVAGSITSYTIANPGAGYLFPPKITVTGNGTGATATATIGYTLTANALQEEYDFSSVPVSTLWPGGQAILSVLSVAVIWANIRYTGNRLSFSQYQSMVRSYTNPEFLYTPFWFTQFGQGTSGSFFIYPVPDQTYPMEWDCLLQPADLVDDTSIDLIPYPWSDAVPFYAAHLALLSTNDPARVNLAFRYFNETSGGLYLTMMRRARAFAQPVQVSSWYGRKLQ